MSSFSSLIQLSWNDYCNDVLKHTSQVLVKNSVSNPKDIFPAYLFIIKLNTRLSEQLISCTNYLPGEISLLRSHHVKFDEWYQMLIFTPATPQNAITVVKLLQHAISDIEWYRKVYVFNSDDDRQSIQSQFLETKPTMPVCEPQNNADAVLSHFLPFDKGVKLCTDVVMIFRKSKKPDYSKLAETMFPLYSQFTYYLNQRRVYFYNAATKLWELHDSMDQSVEFLIQLIRPFLEGPFKKYLSSCRYRADQIKQIKSILCSIDQCAIDLSNTGRSAITRGLARCAAKMGSSNKVDEMGKDIDWLPFRNGIDVNVYTLQMRRRTRVHRQVYCCAVDWKQHHDPQHFSMIEQFFLTIASGDQNRVLDLLTQAFIIFTGKNHKQFFINIGQTSNSKSTLMSLYAQILGEFAVAANKSTFCESRTTASSHTGFLSQLAHRRMILLDDKFSHKDMISISLLKRFTTIDAYERVRNAYSRDEYTIKIQGSIIVCLNPDYIPQNLALTDDPALTRRAVVLPYDTRFVPQAVFDSLSFRDQSSGYYAVSNDALIKKMESEPLLAALAHFILHRGGQEFQKRMGMAGTPFVPNHALLRQYFGQDFADFAEWWKRVAIPSTNERDCVSINAIAECYGDDHPDQPILSSKRATQLIRSLHPEPKLDYRVKGGQGRTMCALNHTLMRELPSDLLLNNIDSPGDFSIGDDDDEDFFSSSSSSSSSMHLNDDFFDDQEEDDMEDNVY